ncbi:hypothetical protein K0M31_007261, partial [Melipona bicolor]
KKPIDDKFLVDAAYRRSYIEDEKVKESANYVTTLKWNEINLCGAAMTKSRTVLASKTS